ncbi:MAG: RnfABCDGE type electron transport complex subunit D [Eubacteriales bacterium]
MKQKADLSSPHIRSGATEYGIAFDILIAATPALVWCAIVYGVRPMITVILSMLCAVIFEIIFALIFHGGARIPTAATLGLTVALFMPAGIGYVFAPIVAFIAITLRRFAHGVVHPVAAALLPLFYITEMTSHAVPFRRLDFTVTGAVGERADSVLDILASGKIPEMSVLDVFLGNAPESIGAISSVLVIIGGLYLVIRRVISYRIPLGYLAGAVVTWLILFFDGAHYGYIFYHLAAGGLILCAFFGATEYSSAPVTPVGRLIYGIGAGALAILLRHFGLYAESVLLAVLIMSLFSRVLDMVTAPKFFGCKDKKLLKRLTSLFPLK